MRRTISFFIAILAIPTIFLYGFYASLQIYGLFRESLFSKGIPILVNPIGALISIFIFLCGISTWILLIPMTKAWCQNKVLDKKIITAFTASMCIGLSPFYNSMGYFSWDKVGVIALPFMIFGIYLIIWHCKNPSIEIQTSSSEPQ